jgi:hypothetical protein
MPGIARKGLDAAGGVQLAGGQGSVLPTARASWCWAILSPAMASRRTRRP